MAASPRLGTGSFVLNEDLWFGDPNDEQAEARAAQSLAAAAGRILGAKPFPIAAKRLEELTRNPSVRLEQVVQVLETDPGLSARLLRLVNSAGYGLKMRCSSVRHAAVLVGTRRLHHVATTAAILDLFEGGNELAFQLLEHASVVGSLCRYLAVHLGQPHDELFTCGFLHDIGKLMLLDTEGEVYAEILEYYGDGPDQMHLQERERFGFDHAVLGAHVLSAWNIPDPVPKVIAWHHQPARALQDTLLSAMVQTLRLADQLSYALARRSDEAGIAHIAESEAAAYLDISEPQLAAMWPDLKALALRSRARSHGEPDLEVVAPGRLEVPRSLRPRSLAPSSRQRETTPAVRGEQSSGPTSSSSPVKEMPEHFPCVVCSKPSFGNVCRVCRGQVCPEHQVSPEEWCSLCVRDFRRFRARTRPSTLLRVAALTVAVFTVGAAVAGVVYAPGALTLGRMLAPLLILAWWALILPLGWWLWVRLKFLRSRSVERPPLRIDLPKPDPVFISSLDDSLEHERESLAKSMPPSSDRIPVSRKVSAGPLSAAAPSVPSPSVPPAVSDTHSLPLIQGPPSVEPRQPTLAPRVSLPVGFSPRVSDPGIQLTFPGLGIATGPEEGRRTIPGPGPEGPPVSISMRMDQPPSIEFPTERAAANPVSEERAPNSERVASVRPRASSAPFLRDSSDTERPLEWARTLPQAEHSEAVDPDDEDRVTRPTIVELVRTGTQALGLLPALPLASTDWASAPPTAQESPESERASGVSKKAVSVPPVLSVPDPPPKESPRTQRRVDRAELASSPLPVKLATACHKSVVFACSWDSGEVTSDTQCHSEAPLGHSASVAPLARGSSG